MNKISLPILALLLASVLACVPTAGWAKGPGGGGPNKVEVTDADPGEADQGQELDVFITGSGFDEGSTATWYVTGTDDSSQVQVLENEFLPATGQLRARIRVNGAAIATDYDIEVRASSGRRGKGTTLFRVQQSAETACTGQESKDPEIAYLTGLTLSGDYETQDIYLSSASGCDRYLLLEDAAVKVPGDVYNGQQEPGPYLVGVRGLRLDVEGDQGVVVWRDEEFELDRLYALRFTISANGAVIPDAAGPGVVHIAPSGARVLQADVRLDAADELELLVSEGDWDGQSITDRRVVYTGPGASEAVVLVSGGCPAQDTFGTCFIPDPGFRPWWNEDGTGAFVNFYDPVAGSTAAGYLQRIEGAWQHSTLLMTHPSQLTIVGIRSDGLMTYERLETTYRRNGRVESREWVVANIDPEGCFATECTPADGAAMPVDGTLYPRNWTRGGSLLFIDTGPGAQRNIGEYSNPFTGAKGPLRIEDVDRYERDTTY